MDTIVEAFQLNAANRKFNSDEIIERLQGLCRLFNCTPETLSNKWEAFCLSVQHDKRQEDKTGEIVQLTVQNLDRFKEYLSRKQEQRMTSQSALQPKQLRTSLGGGGGLALLSSANGQSKPHKRQPSSGQILNQNSFEGFVGQLLKNSKPTSSTAGGLTATPKSDRRLTMDPSSLTKKQTSQALSVAITPQQRRLQQPESPMIAGGSPAAQQFLGRDNRGKIELIFNEGLSSYSAMQMDREQPRCEVALYPDYLTEGYHYMYDKLHTRAQAVDDRLNEMGAIIAEENEFMDAVANPGQPSQEPVKSYGRISADLTNGTTASKMSDRAVLLETSRRIGGGARVHLNFNQVPGFALFPGQIIGVEGINNTGRSEFTLTNLYTPSVPDLPTSNVMELYQYNYGPNNSDGQPMQLLVASGPFTLDDNFAYEPLDSLAETVATSSPDLLILLGPFVDVQNPRFNNTNLDMTPDEIFSQQFVPKLLNMLKSVPSMNVVMIPSLRDVIHPYFVYPQPPLEKARLFGANFTDKRVAPLFERVHCFPNPCIFAVNEVFIGVSTADILFHLGAEEVVRIAKDSTPLDRMSRLIKHLMQQRSFYPLSPPQTTEIPLDYGHLKSAELPLLPDIMILPSRLATFVKNVERSLVINPGPLCKKHSGGTFARFTIHPIAKADFPESVRDNSPISADQKQQQPEMYHGVDGRTRIEIVRV